MYKIGDKVIHSRNGVSTVVNKTTMGEREYFVIHALRGDGENIYVPIIGSENIIRPILNRKEADILLSGLASIEKEFNTNTKQRRDGYKRRLASGKIEDIAYLYRQYWLYRQYPENVKLGPSDIDMLTYATNYLLDELSLTYDISRDMIDAFILTKIEKVDLQ